MPAEQRSATQCRSRSMTKAPQQGRHWRPPKRLIAEEDCRNPSVYVSAPRNHIRSLRPPAAMRIAARTLQRTWQSELRQKDRTPRSIEQILRARTFCPPSGEPSSAGRQHTGTTITSSSRYRIRVELHGLARPLYLVQGNLRVHLLRHLSMRRSTHVQRVRPIRQVAPVIRGDGVLKVHAAGRHSSSATFATNSW